MKRKTLALLLALSFALSTTACSKETSETAVAKDAFAEDTEDEKEEETK